MERTHAYVYPKTKKNRYNTRLDNKFYCFFSLQDKRFPEYTSVDCHWTVANYVTENKK